MVEVLQGCCFIGRPDWPVAAMLKVDRMVGRRQNSKDILLGSIIKFNIESVCDLFNG